LTDENPRRSSEKRLPAERDGVTEKSPQTKREKPCPEKGQNPNVRIAKHSGKTLLVRKQAIRGIGKGIAKKRGEWREGRRKPRRRNGRRGGKKEVGEGSLNKKKKKED